VPNVTDLDALARRIIDSNSYMTLATADETGRPWASPVWFAADGYSEFHWVSSPEVRHSLNLAVRPELAIVIFDSQVPISTGQAVYMEARAEELGGDEIEHGMEVFSRASEADGGHAWGPERVRPPAPIRLYRATASGHWVLDPAQQGFDARTPVTLA
jgi:Pyridoxamine 5'-phosphate oxidase